MDKRVSWWEVHRRGTLSILSFGCCWYCISKLKMDIQCQPRNCEFWGLVTMQLALAKCERMGFVWSATPRHNWHATSVIHEMQHFWKMMQVRLKKGFDCAAHVAFIGQINALHVFLWLPTVEPRAWFIGVHTVLPTKSWCFFLVFCKTFAQRAVEKASFGWWMYWKECLPLAACPCEAKECEP